MGDPGTKIVLTLLVKMIDCAGRLPLEGRNLYAHPF